MRPRQPSGSESREGHARRVKVETAKPAREGSPGGGGGFGEGAKRQDPVACAVLSLMKLFWKLCDGTDGALGAMMGAPTASKGGGRVSSGARNMLLLVFRGFCAGEKRLQMVMGSRKRTARRSSAGRFSRVVFQDAGEQWWRTGLDRSNAVLLQRSGVTLLGCRWICQWRRCAALGGTAGCGQWSGRPLRAAWFIDDISTGGGPDSCVPVW